AEALIDARIGGDRIELRRGGGAVARDGRFGLAQAGEHAIAAIARLREAEATIPRDRAAAAAQFDAIAADASIDQRFRDLAAIRAGLLQVDTASLADMEKRLEPISGTGRPFRHTARELLALSAFRAGDKAALQRWSDLIVSDAESPAQMRARVEAILLLAGIAKG
ncbi:MAG: hypothetical protein ACO1NY_00975, partial [Pseudorhodoplanes sp.]